MEVRNCFRYLPIFLFVSIVSSFFITYAVAVHDKHVAPIWPYVSDIACNIPEKPIFSQLIKLVIILWYINLYLRYLQIEEINRSSYSPNTPRWLNITSACIGVIAGQGLSMFANFSICDVKYVHWIGYFVFALSGVIYFCIQTYISRTAIKWIFITRVLFCLVIVVGSIVAVIAGSFTKRPFEGTGDKFLKPGETGYVGHLVSALCQWIAIFTGSAYVGTLFWEFRQLIMSYPALKYVPD